MACREYIIISVSVQCQVHEKDLMMVLCIQGCEVDPTVDEMAKTFLWWSL